MKEEKVLKLRALIDDDRTPGHERQAAQNAIDLEILKGIFRVGCGHNGPRVHKPNLGPYTKENPKCCVNCGMENPVSGGICGQKMIGSSK